MKAHNRKSKYRRLRKAPPGSAPGVISVSEDAQRPYATVISYDEKLLSQFQFSVAGDIKRHIDQHPTLTHWIEISGFGDHHFYESFSQLFNIHRLEMEDVLSGHQRPKIEESDDHLFIVSRPVTYLREDEFHDEQLSVFIFSNLVITLHENHQGYFSAIKDRLSLNKGIIRKSGAGYLGYAIMDIVVDNYFPVMERLGVYLDNLEDNLLDSPDSYSLKHIQGSKRKLISFRRIVWSEREKINEILKNPSHFFSDTTRRYIRDTYDHTIQVMDIIESYREITASLMEIYLSSVSNRLNQVMKVLTIISTIYIPLTFIVGVYGMNIVYREEASGEIMPWNMPELHSPYGYIGVIVVMLIIVIFQIYYFIKKGWLFGKDGL